MRHAAFALVALVPASLLAGCATSNLQATKQSPVGDMSEQAVVTGLSPRGLVNEAMSSQAGTTFINITPFSTFSDAWSPDSSAQGGQLEHYYTRIIITPVRLTGSDSGSPLPYISRDWLARLLVGKEFAVNLTVSISAGLFKASIPIVTLDHKSNAEDGEQWNRTINHTLGDFPLFLVGAADGTDAPQITFELKDSIDYNSSVVAKSVDAAVVLAQDISPQSAIATKLSAPALQTQAQAVDKAISTLFGQGLDEKHGNSNPIRYWRYDQGINLTLYIPKGEDSFNSSEAQPIGTWHLSFEEPRPSAFVDWRICDPKAYGGWTEDTAPNYYPGTNLGLRCAKNPSSAIYAVYKELDANKVLGRSLASFAAPGTSANSLGSIEGYLSQQSWFKKALGQIGTAKNETGAVPNFCRQIAHDISEVGLSTVDEGIVVWAVWKSSTDLSETGRTAMGKDNICKGWIDPIEAARK
jgi:hypothetical protein